MTNKLYTILMLFCSATCWSTTMHVLVIGENGEAIEDAEVRVWFANPKQKDDGKVSGGNYVTGFTDRAGKFVAVGSGPLGISLNVSKEGYYGYGQRPAESDRRSYQEEEVHKTAILRRVLNPVPLYVKQSEIWSPSQREIPKTGKWIGFDFEKGDWVKPFGKGKTPDIFFRNNGEFVKFRESNTPLDERRKYNRMKYKRNGKHWDEEVFRKEAGLWAGTLEISFPGEKEGLIKVDKDFMPNSALKMPHLAPEDGYEPKHLYNEADGEGYTFRDDVGFFLRTRVELDRQGHIKSANYAKIYGDIQFSPKGYIAFDYYFNPTPNDRNLEFDPKRNLFSEKVEGSRVILP